jgi:triphosphoribosyl-dephospho-CoA synthetase
MASQSYKDESQLLSMDIETLRKASEDSERYITGIPKNIYYLKQLAKGSVPTSKYGEVSSAIDTAINEWIAHFEQVKYVLDDYIKKLENLKITVDNKAISISQRWRGRSSV